MCSSAERSRSCGRLLLATSVSHTATALRSLALRKGQRLSVLAPGLLSLRTDDADAFLTEARRELSSVEADEVRCVVVDGDIGDAAVVAHAMTAPSLAMASARVSHVDLLPLFDDELRRFSSAYQPIVDLADGRVIGHEALLRATLPSGEAVAPHDLFGAAAEAGWTHVLDRIGRTTALRQAGPWLGDDLLFINFVPTSIYRPQVCLRTTEQAALEAGLRLDQLVFEVTEGEQVRDIEHLRNVFAYYRERGCRVALDDLGAGYSSLNMLVQLRPDVVKLDKDIVQQLPDPTGAAVVKAIVDITHAYGGTVLAECVETQAQADAARELDVDLAQGWLFGRPELRVPPAPTAEVTPTRATTRSSAPASRRPDPTRPDPAVALPAHAETGSTEPEPLTALLSRAVHAGAHGVVVVDALAEDMPIVYANAAFARMTGYGPQELHGHNCRVLQGPQTSRETVAGIAAAVERGQEHHCVLVNVRKDGSPWWNELHLSPVHDHLGRLTHYLGFQSDVTARVEAEQRLLHLAGHDALTGLANRTTLLEHLEPALRDAAAGDRAVAVLYVDLDGFKAVNDTHGHVLGDRVLVEAADRLRSALRTTDLLCRHGGDEFVVLLADLDPLDAERVARRVAASAVAALERPLTSGAATVRLSASIGIAMFPGSAGSAQELLSVADAAMYRAKAVGDGTVRVGPDREALTLPVPEPR